jgi:hypothetical protein
MLVLGVTTFAARHVTVTDVGQIRPDELAVVVGVLLRAPSLIAGATMVFRCSPADRASVGVDGELPSDCDDTLILQTTDEMPDLFR